MLVLWVIASTNLRDNLGATGKDTVGQLHNVNALMAEPGLLRNMEIT